MTQHAYKMRSTPDSPAIYDPARTGGILPAVRLPRSDDTGDDPYRYGWRERLVKAPDGSEQLRRIPLTYEDTLNPQLGDYVSEDSIHWKTSRNVSGILEMRYEDDPTVAVWGNLKVRTPSPKKGSGKKPAKGDPSGIKGPAPDVCVMGGVRDRERRRRSVELEKEPGEIWLAIEVVSGESGEKDYGGILDPYNRLKVQEYVAIDVVGDYLDGPVELQAWRRDAEAKQLLPVPLDPDGRFHSRTTGLLFGTGLGGRGLEIRDAAAGELLRPPLEEAAWQAEARQKAEERARREAEARRKVEEEKKKAEEEKKKAEEEKKKAEEEKKKAEQRNRDMAAEIERLRAQLGDR